MLCAHCGALDIGSFAAGYASVPGTNENTQALLCHPNIPGRPDCYRLVTMFNHEMPCHACQRLTKAHQQANNKREQT